MSLFIIRKPPGTINIITLLSALVDQRNHHNDMIYIVVAQTKC